MLKSFGHKVTTEHHEDIMCPISPVRRIYSCITMESHHGAVMVSWSDAAEPQFDPPSVINNGDKFSTQRIVGKHMKPLIR